MKEIFIFVLAVMLGGCAANKNVFNDKPKCDYYIDYIESLYINPFEDSSASGIICEEKNNKSYITIKNGLAHGKAMKYHDNGR